MFIASKRFVGDPINMCEPVECAGLARHGIDRGRCHGQPANKLDRFQTLFPSQVHESIDNEASSDCDSVASALC